MKIWTDKLNRIINLGKDKSTTPDFLKPTLNMFRGRQFTPELKREIEVYSAISIAAQNGDHEAQVQLVYVHRMMNR